MDENNTEEQLTEMTAGEMLRNARTTGRRKREIPTIAKQLCIREEFLQALEDCNYTFIPELVYILGFARNYAMELGLNPDEIVGKIKQELGVVDVPAGDRELDANMKFAKAKSDGNKNTLVRNAIAFVRAHWIWVAAGLALVIIASVVAAFLLLRTPDSAANDAVVTVVEVSANEPKYNLPIKERWGIENRDEAQVILQAARDSWIQIKDGRGKIEFARTLVAGDVYYVPTVGKFKAIFGDAGGIDVWVNGKLAPKVGPDHVRKEDISLSPEKLIPAEGDSGGADVKNETK